MKKDTHKTRVKFVYLEDRLIALFPDIEVADGLIQSYQHIGQHGAASKSLLNNVAANAIEYEKLATELEGFGYNLEII